MVKVKWHRFLFICIMNWHIDCYWIEHAGHEYSLTFWKSPFTRCPSCHLKNWKIDKMKFSIEYPATFDTRLFCTQIKKLLVIRSSVWSTRESDSNHFLGGFYIENVGTYHINWWNILFFNDFPPFRKNFGHYMGKNFKLPPMIQSQVVVKSTMRINLFYKITLILKYYMHVVSLFEQ